MIETKSVDCKVKQESAEQMKNDADTSTRKKEVSRRREKVVDDVDTFLNV